VDCLPTCGAIAIIKQCLNARVRAHIFAHMMTSPETNRSKVVARLERDGWQGHAGGSHDVYKHPARPGRIIVPRHRILSIGVARAISKAAGWKD